MNRVFLFGEAEQGELCKPIRLRDLDELLENMGFPPEGSSGIDYAIQTLLCQWELIFYRVREEGFSLPDYERGIQLIHKHGAEMRVKAICMPGVGDQQVIDSISPICKRLNALLLVSEKDFYDYFTGSKY